MTRLGGSLGDPPHDRQQGKLYEQDIAVLITQRHGTLERARTALESAELPHFVVTRENAASFDLGRPK